MNQDTKKGDSIIVASSILAIAQIVVRLIGLFYRVPLMRIIGDEGMGYYALAFEVYQFLLLLSSNGIPLALSLLTASYLAKKEYKNVQKIFKGTMFFAGGVGTLFGLVTFFGADWIAHFFFSTGNVAPALRVLAPTVIITAVLGVYRGYFQGQNSMMPTAISQIIEQIVNAVVSVVAAYVLIIKGPAYGAAGSTLGTCLGAFSGMIFCMLIYHLYRPTVAKLLKRDVSGVHISYEHVVKMILMTMAPIILSQTAFQLSGILDSSLYSKILAAVGYPETVRVEMYGVYNGEYKLILNVPLAITSSIGIALIPTITRSVTLNLMHEVKEKIGSIIRLTMVIAIPCCVGLMVLASPVMQLVFSDTSELPVKLMLLGAPTIALYSLSTVTVSLLQGVRRMKAPVINSAIAVAVHTVAIVILLAFTDMNIYALVYGNYVFTFVVCLLNIRALRKFVGYRQEFKRTVILPTMVSVIMGIVTWLSYKGVMALLHNMIIAVGVSIILSVIVYGAGIVIFGILTEEELLTLPKGSAIVKLCKKFHVL